MGPVVSPTPSNVASALIIASDATIAALLTQSLQSVGISADVSKEVESCPKYVSRRRYEVAFVDFRLGAGATTSVDCIRSGPSTGTTILIGITFSREESDRAFAQGLHFIIQQPFSRPSVDGIIRGPLALLCAIEEQLRSVE